MKTKPGTEVVLTVIREGKEVDIRVKVGEMPEKVRGRPRTYQGEDLGLTLRELSPEEKARIGEEGLLVVSVVPGSPASRSGLRPGDLIISVNYKRVKTVRDFYRMIDNLKDMGKRKALLLVKRGDTNLYLVLSLE